MPKSWTFRDLDDTPDKENHPVTLYVSQGVTGVYVGQMKEAPGIIVQANTEAELAYEAKESLLFYWKHFPEVHDKMFPKHIQASTHGLKILASQVQLKAIEVSMPQF